MEKNKILIIGFGKMGLSHLKSFLNKNYIIHITEKNNNDNVKYIKKNKLFNKNIFLFKKIPEKQKYLLTICATQSRERFRLIYIFLKKNKTKFLLLEKFCFLKLSHFNEFNNKLKNQTKTFVNSWGYIVAKKMNIKSKLKRFNLVCHVEEGNLLANITHIFHFFSYLNNQNNIQRFYKKKIKVIKNTRNKSYDEIKGLISIADLNKNKLTIITKKKLKDVMIFYISSKYSEIYYKISIKKNNTIDYFNSKIKIKSIKFPFSKITSFIFLKKCINKSYNYLPSFSKDYKISQLILSNLKTRIM
jgi:hypothetical protein